MDEKIIIKSEQYNIKKFCKTAFLFAGGLCAFGLLLYLLNFDECREYINYKGRLRTWSLLDNMFDPFSFLPGLLIDFGLLAAIILAFISWWLSSYELTVTDKRVFGRASFGKRVDLPLDSVSAVATGSMNGIAVATSSGRIVFKLIKNRDEIHKAVSELLINRQKSAAAAMHKKETPLSNADELKKYRELLDMGIISQEEFDAKKKQLLDL